MGFGKYLKQNIKIILFISISTIIAFTIIFFIQYFSDPYAQRLIYVNILIYFLVIAIILAIFGIVLFHEYKKQAKDFQ